MVENCVNTCIITTDLDIVFFKEQVVFTEQKLTLGSKISVKKSPTFHVLSIIIHLIMHEIVPLKIRMCSFALNIYIDVKIKDVYRISEEV
jgi:hypothetical protein